MYKTDITGNINALMHQDIVLERKVDSLFQTIQCQAQIISMLSIKVEDLQKSIEKVGSFLNG